MNAERAALDAARIRRLPLAELRRELLECNVCFGAHARCAHHEDVVGGYATEKIVVVGINPQAANGHAVYSSIQRSTWTSKRDLSDRAYDIYFDRVSPSGIDPLWQWTRAAHPGFRDRGWLSKFCERLEQSPDQLLPHLRFIETFKHATANKRDLLEDRRFGTLARNCPAWAYEQLRRLKPRLIVLCGDDARRYVAPLVFSDATYASTIRDTVITRLHGRVVRADRGELHCCVLFSLAFSGASCGWWSGDPAGTERVKSALRSATRGHDPCPTA